jgi:cytochrome c6
MKARPFILTSLLLACLSPLPADEDPITTLALPAWKKHCLICHGKDGRGRTATGRVLRIVDLTSDSIQKTYTDEGLRKSIVEGVKDDAGMVRMASFEKTLSEAEVDALIAYVRSLAR